jgi:hypothetical protein
VALCSLAILLLQLTLTRLFSATMYYHFAFLAIALALFGSGASGVLVYALAGRLRSVATSRALVVVALLFAATTVAALLVILGNPFSPVDPPAVTLRHLAFVYGATALPFVFGGAAISLAVARFAGSMSRLYVFDLGGAAAGCLLVIPLLDRLGAIDTVLAIAVLGWAAAVAFAGSEEGNAGGIGRRGRALIAVAGLLFAGLFAWNRATGHLEVRRAKGLDEKGHILFEKWNSFSRVTVWGSLQDSSVVIMIDADAGTLVLRGGGVPGQREWLMTRVEALAYHLKRGVNALVIGPGGGADVAMAQAFGARSVTAVEVNPIIAEDVMSRDPFRAWSGAIYEQPGVRLVVDEARSFIRSAPERYDVIQATMVDTWAATAAGAFALTENNLYTVEAFRDYLDRLTPDGVISFTRWHVDPPDQLLRLAAIARAAMAERGIGDPARHLVVVRGPVEGQRARAPATVLVKASPFTDEEVKRLETIATGQGLVPLYTPLTRPPGDLTRIVTAEDPAAVWRSLPSDVSPTRDDRPFFFHTVRPSRLADVRLGWNDEWQKTNLGTFVLAGLAVLTPLVTVGFILGPLAVAGARAGETGVRLLWLLGFAGLGLGYVMVEVVLVQKCILFLGHPVYALTVVLFSLLAWSAAGSFLSGWVGEERLGVLMPSILVGVAALVTVYAFGLSPFFQACVGFPRPARLLLAATVLAPLGVALGAPMPSAIRLLNRAAPRAVPWAWGVNGAASVLGSVGALVVALLAGFDRALLLAAVAYLLALPGLRSLGRSEPF